MAEKTRKSPIRVLRVPLSSCRGFYLPCYFDSRGRMYYVTDTVTNGADYQVTDHVRRRCPRHGKTGRRCSTARHHAGQLLGQESPEFDNRKSDKLTLDEREQFGIMFMQSSKVSPATLCPPPPARSGQLRMNPSSSWPVPVRWSSCSLGQQGPHPHLQRPRCDLGMQILGSFSLDEKCMFYQCHPVT